MSISAFPFASVDISVGGAQIISAKPMEQGKSFKVIISPADVKLPIVILARIVWSKKHDSQESYTIGMEFIEFLNNRKELLEKFIEKH
jgi:c-di-GMP-binding flagellar brake protein YcgR